MEIFKLKEILMKSYSKETCSPGLRDDWTEENPTLGHCAITALLVNELYGGKIMRCMASSGSHYYNLIDDKIVDLTVEQFLGEIPKYQEGEERTREYLLSNEDTEKRYLLLLRNLKYNKALSDSLEIEHCADGIKKKRKKYEKMIRDNTSNY